MILVTGGNGQLGQCFKTISNFQYKSLNRNEFDITNNEQMDVLFKSLSPNIIINCAAYTNVDQCEEDSACLKVNYHGVKNLVNLCNENETTLIHISTDYVFDGSSEEPYKPNHPTCPINAYGKSKDLGEKYIIENSNNYIIIRTSWLYSEHNSNFVKTMIRLFTEKEILTIIDDQIGSPTNANDLAQIITKLCEVKNLKELKEVFHFSNEGTTNWYEFAKEIAELTNSKINIQPIKSKDYKTKAERPKYSVLDTTAIHELAKTRKIDWKESLKKCLKSIH